MKYLLDQAFQVALAVIFLMAFLILLFIGFFLMGRMKRKKRTEEDAYYQKLDRYDAQDYLDFEDIVDGMVVMNKHRRFVAAIKCSGFDLYSASSTQVASTLQGYISFINTITTPITYRQYFVPMSMDYTRNMYAARYEEIEKELFHKNADREALIQRLNQIKGIDLIAEETLIQEIEHLQEDISNQEWRCMHLKEEMDFMDMVCDKESLEPSMEEAYLAEWEYDPSNYSMEMSEEEIHKKAIVELSNICGRMISALGGCNVHAYRCTTEELIEMFYQHSHPLSSAEFKMPDVLNSPYFDEFVTSNDLRNKVKTAYQDTMLKVGARMAEDIVRMTYKEAPKEDGDES